MKKVYLLLLSILFAATINAQVTGTKTIGVDYPTIAAAVNALNTTGVGAGGATINVPAGYTETAPAGGYLLGTTLLNASLSAANPLVFQKSGAGANPLITAPVGTSTTVDAIFVLAGTDYVTISSINLNDPNAATTAAMEWGYAMVNLNAAAPFDGCQFVTIQNCTITLNRTNPNASFGIYSGHNTAASTAALTITAVGDLHSNNKIYGNTISNTTIAIFLAGFAAASPYTLYDQNNDVGGSSAATGNTISNTGNLTGFNAFGVYLANHNNANASFNTINYFQGFGGTAVAYGIYFFGTNSNATGNNNTISLGQAAGTGDVTGIYAQNTGSIVATNNSISFADAGGSGAHYGVRTASATTVNISSNTFTASNTGAVTGAYQFIYDASTGTGETFTNNVFNNININTTGTTYLIYASNSTPNQTSTGNITTGSINRTGASGTMYGYYNFGSPASGTANVSGNTFSNINLSGATAFYGVYQATGTGQIENVNNNTISNITAGTGTLIGIHQNYGAVGSSVNGNTVSTITGTGAVTGIQVGNATASLGLTVSNNVVNTLSTTGAATVSGMIHTSGNNSAIFKNKIYNLSANNAAGVVNGLTIAGGVTISAYNNLIGDLRAPSTNSATDAVRGINITSSTAASNINLYYNTVYLNAASTGANFGTSGVFHTTSTTATTASLTMQNNIIYNNSFASGTGFVSAFRRSSGAASTLSNYNAASNNNLFFAGAPGSLQLIYYDGTSSAQTLAAYKAGVFTAGTIAPRDAASVTELSTPFLSTVGANANFLHISTVIPTVVESAGANIAAVTDDYDGNARNAVTPDIGADEFAGLVVTACAGTPAAGSISGTGSICQGQFSLLTVAGYPSSTGISLQWKSSAVAGGPYSPIAGAVGTSYNTGVLPVGTVYYVVTVTCANGGGNATTAEFAVTSNAIPTVTVTPPAPTICSGGAGVTLTATGALTYTWSPATGLSSTTGGIVTANPASTTTYTVTGTNAAGCTNTANVTVTVNLSPAATTSATPSTVCVGSNSQLS